MPETRFPYRAGDPYRCPRCRQDHVVEQPYRAVTTAERQHLYITCQGAQYFVGIAPPEALMPESLDTRDKRDRPTAR